MILTPEQAIERVDTKQYISYRFHIFDDVSQSYYHILLSKDQVKNLSNKFVTLNEYSPKGGNYSYSYSYNYKRYEIKTMHGDTLHIYHRKGAGDINEFQEFLSLISEHPSSYQYYLGDLEENSKYVDLLIFIDMEIFLKFYQENGFLSKNMVKIVQKYALNQYKIYKIKDCSTEPDEFKINPIFKLKLFDYQNQTLNWMTRIENKDYKFLVPQSSFYKLGDKAYIELIQKHIDSFLSQYVFETDYQTNEMIKCRGGILADIMGNGKTVTTIALIYHNRPTIFPLLTSIVEREVYVPSKATLVVCPTNIATQWEDEIHKCLGPNAGGLSIAKITTKTQMNKYNLSDLVNADIIITTYTWLSHTSHIGTGFVKKGKATELLAEQKKNRSIHEDKYHLYKNHTLLFIKYHRIIYDEFHEEIDSNQSQNSILYMVKNCLKAKNIWGISGTPLLENERIMSNIPDLLQIRDTHNTIYNIDVISQHEIFDRFIRRNEKQYLPPIEYRVFEVKQNIQEKQLYDSSSSQDIETLMQLCCYHNINSMDIQSIDDVSKVQNDLRQKQKKELIEKIEDLNINLKQIETILKTMNPLIKNVNELYYLIDSKHPQHTHKLVLQIQMSPTLQLQVESLRQYRKYENQLELKTDELNKLEQCMSYYEQTMKNTLVSGNFICPITGEPVGDGEVVITKEGNLFSKNAIEMLFEYGDGKYINCPVTGNKLSKGDLTIVTNKQTTNVDLSLNSNERLFGSKITKIIDEIKALAPNEKVILFANWEKLLHTIGYALDTNNINHVYIKGNVSVRDKAIHDFQKNPAIKAILLSSVYGASGVNLTEATHVFIVHPFYGDDGHQYEKQAIGRAYRTGQTKKVMVSFFITQNTIEQELWEKNRKGYYLNANNV